MEKNMNDNNFTPETNDENKEEINEILPEENKEQKENADVPESKATTEYLDTHFSANRNNNSNNIIVIAVAVVAVIVLIVLYFAVFNKSDDSDTPPSSSNSEPVVTTKQTAAYVNFNNVEDADKFAVEVAMTQAKPGDEVIIPVSLKNTAVLSTVDPKLQICSAQFFIEYDETKLEFVSGELDPALPFDEGFMMKSIDKIATSSKIIGVTVIEYSYNEKNSISSDCVFANLKFKVKDGATDFAAISIKDDNYIDYPVDFVGMDENKIFTAKVIDGGVTISAE